MPLLASGYGFCQLDAKTEDHFFKGFPSYWNVVVFYFYTLGTSRWFNIGALIVFSVLVFVPIGYLYPSRNPTLRRTHTRLGIVWAFCLIVLLGQFPNPSRHLAQASLLLPCTTCSCPSPALPQPALKTRGGLGETHCARNRRRVVAPAYRRLLVGKPEEPADAVLGDPFSSRGTSSLSDLEACSDPTGSGP